MGLFNRIYNQGYGAAVEYPPNVHPIRGSVHVGAEEAPPRPAPQPAPRREGTSPFAWGVLGVAALFGAGYLARAFKPKTPSQQDEE